MTEKKEMPNTRAINVQIPLRLAEDVDRIGKELGYTKKQLVIDALRTHLMILEQEQAMKQEHPGKPIKTKVIFEVVAGTKKMDPAAVVLY
ncbi:hypothetical protein SCOR_04820 [Sulfidibacter corallicola]|uniref:Uncharacterized protein n=1 Tax=Sulfidibacter corallicola TaxID=2818388 RepID=A0A8A4TQU9_SULCO|nr:hypothetical protein [Sulfidibacter corallicola]QTD51903.1 hypothetical protein J3U87_05475 [Sulfidibacter corallicola]